VHFIESPECYENLLLTCFLVRNRWLVQYDLHYGELAEHRKMKRGTVTVRLRIEWESTRKAIMVGLKLPRPTYVSVSRKIDFQVAHYVTEGKNNENKFSMATFTRHIEELQSYEKIMDHLKPALLTVSYGVRCVLVQ
jgi:hypothetical protein